MNLLWFMLGGIVVFFSIFLGGKKYRSTALYALAIGGVVNTNFFNAGYYPINIFGLSFGIDSLLYSLFVFCVIVMFFLQGKKDAYVLMFSSVIAIIFSSLMQLMASLLTDGSSRAVWITFLNFFITAVATVIAISVMLEILERIKQKNVYLVTIIGMIIAMVLNSGIYFPLVLHINGTPNNIGILLLSSFIGKIYATLLSLLTLFLLNIIDKNRKTDKIDKIEKVEIENNKDIEI